MTDLKNLSVTPYFCRIEDGDSDYFLLASQKKNASVKLLGAIAQLGERYNGIVEVGGSIPPGSTINRGIEHDQYRETPDGIKKS